MIKGLSHMTFLVRDLERSARLVETVLGGRQVYSSEEKTYSLSREKFFLAGGLWLCLMEGEPLGETTYNHVAFSDAEEELAECEKRVRALGLAIRPARSRVPGEGRSLYFYDYDGHLFELHTGTLEQRLASYGREE